MDKNTQYLNIKRNFQENYIKQILPLLNNYNKTRIKIISQMNKIALPVGFLICCLLAFFIPTNFKIVPFILLVVAYLYACEYFKKDLEIKIKNEVGPVIFKCLPDLEPKKGVYINNLDIFDSLVAKKADKCSFGTIIYGKYENSNFEIVDMILENFSKKNKKSIETIDNLIIKFKIDKPINSHTIILPENQLHNSPKAGLNYVKMNDVAFKEKMDVFSDNEDDAKTLISTALMNNLFNIQKLFNAKGFRASFYKNTFYLALTSPNRNKIKVSSIFKSIKDMVSFTFVFDQVFTVYKLIDYFKFVHKFKNQ